MQSESGLSNMQAADFPIQKAGLKDLESLRRLEKACFCKNDVWPLLQLVWVLTAPGLVRLKIENGDEAIAFLSGEYQREQGIGWINSIGVAPDWQGKGLGKRLLQAGEQALAAPRVRLIVRASNQAAIALYQHSGYRQVKRMPHYYVGGEDGLLFEKFADEPERTAQNPL